MLRICAIDDIDSGEYRTIGIGQMTQEEWMKAQDLIQVMWPISPGGGGGKRESASFPISTPGNYRAHATVSAGSLASVYGRRLGRP